MSKNKPYSIIRPTAAKHMFFTIVNMLYISAPVTADQLAPTLRGLYNDPIFMDGVRIYQPFIDRRISVRFQSGKRTQGLVKLRAYPAWSGRTLVSQHTWRVDLWWQQPQGGA